MPLSILEARDQESRFQRGHVRGSTSPASPRKLQAIGKRPDSPKSRAGVKLLGQIEQAGRVGAGSSHCLREREVPADEVRAGAGVQQRSLQAGDDSAVAGRLDAEPNGVGALEYSLQGLPADGTVPEKRCGEAIWTVRTGRLKRPWKSSAER